MEHTIRFFLKFLLLDDMKSKSTYVDYRLWKTHMIIHFEEHSIFSTLLAFKDAF